MLVVQEDGGCLTKKNPAQCKAVLPEGEAIFVDFFHFYLLLLTFFTARNFYKLFFTTETGVRFVTFYYFFYCL
jgi:hypothetical protein